MNAIRLALVTAGCLAAIAPALAQTYDFQTVSGPDAGTSVACTGLDRCATAVGGSMTFFSGAVAARGFHLGNDATSMLDNFSDRPSSRPDLKWVGLGVYHTSPFDSSDDNVTRDEKLVLTFAAPVVITNVFLRAEGHYANFDSAAKFRVSSNAGSVDFSFANGVNSYSISSPGLGASTTWAFYGLSNEARKQYYVSAITVVPEPEAYGLALAGMGVMVMALAMRKRRSSAA